jgi:hypothetical protein
MKRKLLAIAAVVGAGLLAASGQAEVIAGWDFSQFRNPGALTGGAVPLPANYSFADSNGAGAEAALYASASVIGGSWLPTAGEGQNCQRRPDGVGDTAGCAAPNVDGPVRSNRSEPFSLGMPSFDAHSILKAEGQPYTNLHAMMAPGGDVTVVFEVLAPFTNGGADGWQISFGGKMMSGNGDDGGAPPVEEGGQVGCSPGCTANVSARWSSDGIVYNPAVADVLDIDDDRIVLDLNAGPDASTTAFVELTIDGSPGRIPVIDNVAIEAIPLPEPSGAVQMLFGVGCLLGLRRLRR